MTGPCLQNFLSPIVGRVILLMHQDIKYLVKSPHFKMSHSQDRKQGQYRMANESKCKAVYLIVSDIYYAVGPLNYHNT